MDGEKEHHDFSVCYEGGYDAAVRGIKAAIARGFRVTTNTTLFDGADPNSVRRFFDDMMELGVEDMMLSPGYSYDKAPDQSHFLGRARSRRLFKGILSNRKAKWRFNNSSLYNEFLMGLRTFTCSPWGMPTYNVFRLAEALLFAARRICGHVPGIDCGDGVGELRDGIRESEVRELHGA